MTFCLSNMIYVASDDVTMLLNLIQVLERICTRESSAVFDSGGLNCVLTFVTEYGSQVHKDTLHSAMAVVSRLCGKMEPQDSSLESCVESLSTLLEHEDQYVCFFIESCISYTIWNQELVFKYKKYRFSDEQLFD